MTLNDWYSLFQVVSVLLLFFTFVCGAGVILTGLRVNKESTERMRELDLELSKQRERAAKAENDLLVLQSRVKPRAISVRFIDAIRDKPHGVVSAIWHLPNDGEALQFAMQLFVNLAGLGWPPIWPSGVPPGAIREHLKGMSQESRDASSALMLMGGQPTGITLVAKSLDDSTFELLQSAFAADGFGVAGSEDKTLPENTVEIIVGPKP